MKSKNWPNVPLGEILKKSDRWIELDPAAQYKEVTVRLWGKGVILRREVSGSEIASKKRLQVKTGQFILSRIDARHGAFGLIPQELDGGVVSNDFPVFEVNESRLLPAFLGWLSHTHDFIDFCRQASEGTTNRVRLKEHKFLATEMLLPPLAEQQRIVTKIEQLAAKVVEAQKLNISAITQTEIFLQTARNEIFSKELNSAWTNMRLEEVAPVNMGQSPPGYSYNTEREGIPLLNGPTEFGKEYPKEIQWTTKLTKLCKKGDLLICVRGATTGRTNWADKEYCIGRGLAALTVNEHICLSKYVYHFITFSTQKLLALSAGSTFPNLPGTKLKTLKIPCPTLEEQRRIVVYLDTLQAQVDRLKHLQAQTQTELDALLPSILDKAFQGEL